MGENARLELPLNVSGRFVMLKCDGSSASGERAVLI